MIEKSYTDEEIAAIVRKHGLPRYPEIALLREKLSRKAKDMRIRNILPERAVKGGNPQMMRRAANRLSKLNDAVATKVKRF